MSRSRRTGDLVSESNLYIDSSGNIGINQSSPDRKLHIKGAGSNADNNLLRFEINTAVTADMVLGGLEFEHQDQTSPGVKGYYKCFSEDGGTDVYHAWGVSGGATVSEALRITSRGNVGIGTDNPDQKLHVSGGNIKVDSGYGIDFSATSNSSGTMTSELLDDYEEGTFTMTMSVGGNTDTQECRYTKIGRVVYIEGHGDAATDNFFNTGNNGAGAAVTITSNLPFTPVRTGAAPITVSRTLVGANGFEYERMYVGWIKDSATIYLGSEVNQYSPTNNVETSNNQTNKVILFSGYFVTEV